MNTTVGRVQPGFKVLLGVNILAAYVPGFFWIFNLPGSGPESAIYLISPVALLTFFVDPFDGNYLLFVCLLVFLSLVAALSYVFRGSRNAVFIMPSIVFISCLSQGLLTLEVARGLDAISRS